MALILSAFCFLLSTDEALATKNKKKLKNNQKQFQVISLPKKIQLNPTLLTSSPSISSLKIEGDNDNEVKVKVLDNDTKTTTDNFETNTQKSVNFNLSEKISTENFFENKPKKKYILDASSATKINNFQNAKNRNQKTQNINASIKLPRVKADILELTDEEAKLLKEEGVELIEEVFYKTLGEYELSWGASMIKAKEAHNVGIRGEGIKIGIIDTGIDINHPDFANVPIIGLNATSFDFPNDLTDETGHGTEVAGIIVSEINGANAVGIAPKATLYVVKAGKTNGISTASVIIGLNWLIEQNVDVINMSFGSYVIPTPFEFDAIETLTNAGTVIVASAGNDGNCNGDEAKKTHYPSGIPNVISVSAVDVTKSRACFSQVAPEVELTAPGVNTLSTRKGGGYWNVSGTSMSSAHVAGAVALLKQFGVEDINHNGRINDDIREILTQSAEDLGKPGRDTSYGYGLIDVTEAFNLSRERVAPPKPELNIKANTNKNSFKKGFDENIVLNLEMKNENGQGVSGLSQYISESGSGATNLPWQDLNNGNYQKTIPVENFSEGTKNISIIVNDTSRNITSTSNTLSFEILPPDPTVINQKTKTNGPIFINEESNKILITTKVSTDVNNLQNLTKDNFKVWLQTTELPINYVENIGGGYYYIEILKNLIPNNINYPINTQKISIEVNYNNLSSIEETEIIFVNPGQEIKIMGATISSYKNGLNNKNYIISSVIIGDEKGLTITDASVTVKITKGDSKLGTFSGKTNSMGVFSQEIKSGINSGCINIEILEISKEGYEWKKSKEKKGDVVQACFVK